MKKLVKLSLATAIFAAATGSAFASSYDDMREAKAKVDALSAQLGTMGVTVEPVSFDRPMTFSQKEDAYNNKYAELQATFNKIHFAK